MNVEITLKNYRCFPESSPAHIRIRNGFTAFIGPNNAGKSSLIRFFVEFRTLFQWLSSSDFMLLVLQHPRAIPVEALDPQEVFSNMNVKDISMEFRFEWDMPDFRVDGQLVPTFLKITIERSGLLCLAEFPEFPIDGQVLAAGDLMYISGKPYALGPLFDFFKNLARTLYVGPFRNVVNIGTNQSYFDIKVGASFIEQWRAFKTGPSKKQNEIIIRLTEDIRKIFGYESLEIDASSNSQTLQVNIDRKSYKLPELGTGLAQFILVLGNVAIQKPSLLLIDEPELSLHPSLQIDFLTTLASYAEEGVLFSTHSFGLARAIGDQVYTLNRLEQGRSEVRLLERTPRLSEFLGEMGFSAYQDLGFECVLLVEGSTEVKTIQQLLRLYRKDHKVVLLSLGGSDMIKPGCDEMLIEIKRISAKIFALIDSERSAPAAVLSPARQGFVEACAAASVDCHVLERRAIENYFPGRAIKLVHGDEFESLDGYQRLRDAPRRWGKSENWRIAREMWQEELDATDLGAFLANLPV